MHTKELFIFANHYLLEHIKEGGWLVTKEAFFFHQNGKRHHICPFKHDTMRKRSKKNCWNHNDICTIDGGYILHTIRWGKCNFLKFFFIILIWEGLGFLRDNGYGALIV